MNPLEDIFNEGVKPNIEKDDVVIPKLTSNDMFYYLGGSYFPFYEIYLQLCKSFYLMIVQFNVNAWQFGIWNLQNTSLGSVKITFEGGHGDMSMKITNNSDSNVKVTITDQSDGKNRNDLLLKPGETISMTDISWEFYTTFFMKMLPYPCS